MELPYIIDINDLDNPVFTSRYTDGTIGLDHNFVVEDDKLYIASYTSGTRVLQINRDESGVSLAPFPNSDTIIATDINNGLIVMRLSDEACHGIKCSK